MEQSLRGRVKARSDESWTGIRGAPTILSSTKNSLFNDDLSGNRAFMRVRRFCHRLKPLDPMLVNISSGIGTSSTVSNPSSLSKLGHNFFMILFERKISVNEIQIKGVCKIMMKSLILRASKNRGTLSLSG